MTEVRTPLIRRKGLFSILHADIATRIPYQLHAGHCQPITGRDGRPPGNAEGVPVSSGESAEKMTVVPSPYLRWDACSDQAGEREPRPGGDGALFFVQGSAGYTQRSGVSWTDRDARSQHLARTPSPRSDRRHVRGLCSWAAGEISLSAYPSRAGRSRPTRSRGCRRNVDRSRIEFSNGLSQRTRAWLQAPPQVEVASPPVKRRAMIRSRRL